MYWYCNRLWRLNMHTGDFMGSDQCFVRGLKEPQVMDCKGDGRPRSRPSFLERAAYNLGALFIASTTCAVIGTLCGPPVYRVLAAPCASFAAVVLAAFQCCPAWMVRLVADRFRGALVLGATFHILADPLGRDVFYSSIRAALDDDAVFLTSFSAFVLGALAFLENYCGLSSSVYFPASETSTRGVTGTCVASLGRLPDVANAESVEITSVRRRLRVVRRSMKRRSSSTGAAGARRTTRLGRSFTSVLWRARD